MRLRARHAWDLTPAEAVALQRVLRAEVIADRPIDLGGVRCVAGVDVSVKGARSRAAVVVATFPDFGVIETATADENQRGEPVFEFTGSVFWQWQSP